MTETAEQTGLHRVSLYKMLDESGNPELRSVDKILHVVGLRLAVVSNSDGRAESHLRDWRW